MVNTTHKNYFLATLEKLMKEWTGGSYLVMNITSRVPSDILLMENLYKQNYRRVILFIATDGDGGTETGDPYLPFYPDNYSKVSFFLVVHPHFIGRHINVCNPIHNHDSIR